MTAASIAELSWLRSASATAGPALRRRLLALNLLHRYSRLDYFLELVGVDGYPSGWDEVATSLLGW